VVGTRHTGCQGRSRESDVGPGDVEGQGELQSEVAEMALTREDAEAGHIVRLRIDVVGVTAERAGMLEGSWRSAVQWCVSMVWGSRPICRRFLCREEVLDRRRGEGSS
jgi:hypothetical protein